MAEHGWHERGPQFDCAGKIRFEHRGNRPVGSDARPFTQTELQVVDRTVGLIGHGDRAPVLPVTDHRNDGAGHRQHVDAQDDKSIEDGRATDITQDIRDSRQAVRVHPSRRRERRSPRYIADGHVAHSHLGPEDRQHCLKPRQGPDRSTSPYCPVPPLLPAGWPGRRQPRREQVMAVL
jgi:hypothetical protein